MVLPKQTSLQVLQSFQFEQEDKRREEKNQVKQPSLIIYLRFLFSSEVNQVNHTPISSVQAGMASSYETAWKNRVC